MARYVAGAVGIASAHDPELSPDNRQVVFSVVNSSVPPNFPDNPAANTAHDIWQVGLDGPGSTRLTRPGPISIAPDWKGDSILYLDISQADRYAGISLVQPNLPEQPPRRIGPGVNIGKWIPDQAPKCGPATAPHSQRTVAVPAADDIVTS